MKRMPKIAFYFIMIIVLSAGPFALPALGANFEPDLGNKLEKYNPRNGIFGNASERAASTTVDFYEFDETEPNNSKDEANVINNNYSGESPYLICGTITDKFFDEDYYRFTVTGSGEVEIAGCWIGDYFEYGWEDELLFGLISPLGYVIEAELIGIGPEKARYLNTHLSAGTYYIYVCQKDTYPDLFIDEPYGLYLDFTPDVKRIAGGNRFETAVNVSQAGWSSANTVILARSDDYADALAGVPLAHQLNGPILLTQTNNIAPVTVMEIMRLNARRIILLGGHAAISDAVKKELEGLGLNVERINGANRYETSFLIGQRMAREGAIFNTAFLAVGGIFADALAASAYAAIRHQPILLTETNYLPEATRSAIVNLGIRNTVICGGANAISGSVFAQLPNPKRVSGDNRYLTALEMAKKFLPKDGSQIYISTGLNFPDALAGGVLAAKNNSGVLLVQGNEAVPCQQIKDFIKASAITDVTIFGGTKVVSSELEDWFKHNLR